MTQRSVDFRSIIVEIAKEASSLFPKDPVDKSYWFGVNVEYERIDIFDTTPSVPTCDGIAVICAHKMLQNVSSYHLVNQEPPIFWKENDRLPLRSRDLLKDSFAIINDTLWPMPSSDRPVGYMVYGLKNNIEMGALDIRSGSVAAIFPNNRDETHLPLAGTELITPSQSAARCFYDMIFSKEAKTQRDDVCFSKWVHHLITKEISLAQLGIDVPPKDGNKVYLMFCLPQEPAETSYNHARADCVALDPVMAEDESDSISWADASERFAIPSQDDKPPLPKLKDFVSIN